MKLKTILFSCLFFSVLVLIVGLADARTYGTGAYGTGQYGNDTTAPTVSSFTCTPTTSIYTGDTITCSCSATDDTGISPTVSYTTNPSTASSGSFTTTCTATDSNNNTASSSVTYSVNQRGSGGSGGGGATEVKQSNIWVSIESGKTLTLNIAKEDLKVESIEFTTNKDLSNVKLTVTKLASKPESVDAPTGTVARYLEITKEKLENADIASAKIKFKVDKSWLTENNIDEKDVVLLRYTTKWDELATTKTTSTDTSITYEAETPGFSYFAISTKTQAVEQPVEQPENQTEEQPEEPVVVEPPKEEPKAPADNTWLLVGAVIVVIIIILVAVVAFRKKK